MEHCAKISITFCPVWSGGRNAITADGRGISKGNVDVVAQCYSNNALMSKIWHHNKRKINLQSASRFVQLNFGTKLPREEGNFRLWNNRCFGPQLKAEGVVNCTFQRGRNFWKLISLNCVISDFSWKSQDVF